MTDKLRDAAQQAPMAYYALVIKADSGYESTTEGRCTADQYGAAMAALHGTAALAQQDAQKKHKPLFAEMIAQHPGLAEELAQHSVYQLPDDLYPDSKDWVSGTYAERVEWLHSMYECSKRTLNSLVAQQDAQAVVQEPCAVVKWQTGGPVVHIIGDVHAGDLLYRAAPTPPAQEPLTDEQERANFEAFWLSEIGGVDDLSYGGLGYVIHRVACSWEAWKARAALAEQPTQQDAQAVPQWANAAFTEIAGCFDAAIAEGLLDALAETRDKRLKDLVVRRLMYAHAVAAQAAAPTPTAQQDEQAMDHIPDAREMVSPTYGSEEVRKLRETIQSMARIIRDYEAAPTPPAQRVTLTDEEIERIYTEETGSFIDDSPWALKDFARAIIEAYERKNGKEAP